MKKQKEKFLNLPIPPETIERRIFVIRGQKVMLDSDLAELYQVPTKVLNQAVRRNINRFPEDFVMTLTKTEYKNLRSQFVTSSYGGQRYLSYAFTEQGIAMLSSVLRSPMAIQMNIFIIRAFIQLRKNLAEHENLSERLNEVEDTQKLHDQVLTGLVHDIKRIKNPPKTNAIGFQWKNK